MPETLKLKIQGEPKWLEVSPDHPFFAKRARSNTSTEKDADGAWTEAYRLRVGDLVKTRSGKWVRVLKVLHSKTPKVVYNFEVAKSHTYFVGSQGVLVHNSEDVCPITDPARLLGPPKQRGNPVSSQQLGPFYFVERDFRGTPLSGLVSGNGIIRTDRANRVIFEGMEFRAVRDLSHIPERDLRAMAQIGFAGTDRQGRRLVLHHLGHNSSGPVIEIPRIFHRNGNRVQHPFGNTPGTGIPTEIREAFNLLREEYWKARAWEELGRRGLR